MSGDERDEKAQQLLVVGKRIASKLRTDVDGAHHLVRRVPPEDLPALVCVLAALVPPGPVDRWWERTTVSAEIEHRRAVLVGEIR